MAKKNSKETKESKNKNHRKETFDAPVKKLLGELKVETKHSILAVFSFLLGLIIILSYFNSAGMAGIYINKILLLFFGNGLFLVPAIFFFSSVSFFYSIRPNLVAHTLIGGVIFLISALGALASVWGLKAGGYVGHFASLPLLKLFDFSVSLIVLVAISIISVLVMLNMPIISFFKRAEKDEEEDVAEEEMSDEEIEKKIKHPKEEIADEKPKEKVMREKKQKEEKPNEEEFTPDTKSRRQKNGLGFAPPPIELLESDKGKPSSGDIKANANIIKRTLQNFGIDVEMGEINIGPSVTQYTLKPAEGVKISRILGLQNDLALALAAHPLRIEAPIPGRSLVGVEIPNNTKTIIGLASLFKDEDFKNSKHSLLVAMGRDVAGKAIFSNMAKMPHLLVAGATGSGKSIFIHTLITSLIYRNSPEMLRFIMVDPKRVELTTYNSIPHMLTPTITDTKKAIMTLKWLGKEMERRYDVLLGVGVRDIGSYHDKKPEDHNMPYLVVILDELADLMTSYPREMEASIVRLAQMSRAVGIHLVLSTQRPSVEVITGLIKANITTRVALQVASQIDSRTIIDSAGAEKLLGRGDMLFLAADSGKPKRIQGPYVSEKEVKSVVDYLADQYKNTDFEDMNISAEQSNNGNKMQSALEINFDEAENDMDDDLYEEARQTVIETGKASTSFLQRKLKVGYARAARLVDMLEERGVVSAGDGAKARQVLISNNGDAGNSAALEAEADRLLGEGEEKSEALSLPTGQASAKSETISNDQN